MAQSRRSALASASKIQSPVHHDGGQNDKPGIPKLRRSMTSLHG
jgi:hypothetical protein